MSEGKINLIYILSNGHSGSTLLDLLVSSHQKVFGIGEAKNFHKFVSNKNKKLCTCDKPISKCQVWKNVLSNVSHDYTKSINQSKHFEERNYDLFKTINEVTDTTWVCDSSKNLNRFKKLLDSEKFNVLVLHLVRDGRAVAFSNKKKMQRVNSSELKERITHIRKYNFYLNLIRWSSLNQKVKQKYSGHPNYYLLKYEDLVEDVEWKIKDIWNKIGLDADSTYLDRINEIEYHNIGGNRMRFDEKLEIKKDTEYLDKIGTFNWLISTNLIKDCLLNFGYSKKKEQYKHWIRSC